jgi:hypothetical protein
MLILEVDYLSIRVDDIRVFVEWVHEGGPTRCSIVGNTTRAGDPIVRSTYKKENESDQYHLFEEAS